MRLLVTGGAGSLGSNLINHWETEIESCVVIDNFATGKIGSLAPNEKVKIIEGSITDLDVFRNALEIAKPDFIIHSAASYKDPNDWTTDAQVNIQGSINLVNVAKEFGVRRIVNFQTALCYGKPEEVPIPITHRLKPITSYGISKTAGELVLLNSGLDVISLRLANVTGPRLSIGPIPTFYKNLKAGIPSTVSTTIRDFLDMSDFLSLMDIIKTDFQVNGIFNVSTGSGNTIQEIFEAVARYLDMPNAKPEKIVLPGADDISAVVLDPSITTQTFGWKAQCNFTETINRMLQWYDKHGVTDIFSHLQKEGG